MTDKELKELVASLAIAQRETEKQMSESRRETEKQMSESRRETEKQMSESRRELEKQIKATEDQIQRTSQQIALTNKQLGELGNKWGTFAEGMAIASIKKILNDEFNLPLVSERTTKRIGGDTIELDAFGYENSTVNTAMVVEIKSHLKEDAIEQLEDIMKNFPKFFPDHANKKLYGMIACVHAPESLRNMLRKKGIYLAVLHDDVFQLYTHKNFIPTDFNLKRA